MQAPEPGHLNGELEQIAVSLRAQSPEQRATIQDVETTKPTTGVAQASDLVNTAMMWTVQGNINRAPSYWSRQRDQWMVDWLKEDGNDMLAGAHSTLVAKVAGTDFYVEGPLALAMLYRDILLNQIGFGAGWQPECSRWVDAFLNRDFGGTMECLRSSPTDYTGPALGFAHLDESLCYPTGIPDWPIIYYNAEKGPIPVHQSQVCWITDMPEPRDQYRGVGFCSVSRALSTAQIMQMLVKYKEQSLSDLPPAGILLIGNMTRTQWQDVEKRYDARQQNQGNTVWQDILTAFSLDPAYPVTAELIELSKLWEHFDEQVATSIAMYSFALAYRVDPREYWPVSQGALGTAMEAEIQDRKARTKGPGIIYTAIERQLNRPTRLPDSVTFRFDYRDTEEDRTSAEIRELHIQNIRRLWEASPNRVANSATLPPGEQGAGSQAGSDLGPEEQENDQDNDSNPKSLETRQVELDGEDAEDRLGIISTEEARALLVHWGVVPAELLGQTPEINRLYDVKSTEVYGPVVRAHSDGRVTIMKREMMPGERRAWREYTTGSSGRAAYMLTRQPFVR